jgi:hypothetical protein
VATLIAKSASSGVSLAGGISGYGCVQHYEAPLQLRTEHLVDYHLLAFVLVYQQQKQLKDIAKVVIVLLTALAKQGGR